MFPSGTGPSRHHTEGLGAVGSSWRAPPTVPFNTASAFNGAELPQEDVQLAQAYLIVDDSPVIRKLLEKLLIKEGVPAEKIHAVGDGAKAVETFREVDPGVVFMDIDMPGMDGEEAASLMLMEEPELKVVIVSALERDDDRVRGLLSFGAFEIVQKPVRSEDVARVLNLIEEEESGRGRIK